MACKKGGEVGCRECWVEWIVEKKREAKRKMEGYEKGLKRIRVGHTIAVEERACKHISRRHEFSGSGFNSNHLNGLLICPKLERRRTSKRCGIREEDRSIRTLAECCQDAKRSARRQGE